MSRFSWNGDHDIKRIRLYFDLCYIFSIKMIELPKYESSEEFRSVRTEKSTKLNKKTRHAWIFLYIYDTANKAVSFIKGKKIWSNMI